MPIAASASALSLWNALLLGPDDAQEEWWKWRSETDLDDLDSDCLEAIPLLWGRLSRWLSQAGQGGERAVKISERQKIFGICKRGWVQNQLRYRDLTAAWNRIRQCGVEPLAIGGCAAWAMLYWEEKAVRPIWSVDIMVREGDVLRAQRALLSAGWMLSPGTAVREASNLDWFDDIWLLSPAQTSLSLTWRIRRFGSETIDVANIVPCQGNPRVMGVDAPVMPTDPLLLDALTRTTETAVGWKCDALVLQRNRGIDWQRFRDICHDLPLASQRLAQLRRESSHR